MKAGLLNGLEFLPLLKLNRFEAKMSVCLAGPIQQTRRSKEGDCITDRSSSLSVCKMWASTVRTFILDTYVPILVSLSVIELCLNFSLEVRVKSSYFSLSHLYPFCLTARMKIYQMW